MSAINHYLVHVYYEAVARGYKFDKSRIGPVRNRDKLSVTSGQLVFEVEHLRRKILNREPDAIGRLPVSGNIIAHPIFNVRTGQIERWEKGQAGRTI